MIEATNTEGSYWIHLKGLATCAASRVYQLGMLQYENTTTNNLHALTPDPGYDGFPLPENYRVSRNDVTVARVRTLRTVSPLHRSIPTV